MRTRMQRGVERFTLRVKSKRRALAWAALAAALALAWPAGGQAAIDDSLNAFFTDLQGAVTGTAAGAYQSQSRGHLTAGGLSARVPMQSVQLASFQPPRFQLGCNGFDATFGGLSYVSLDRFVQLLQQLGTGAVVGFAFQLAMEYLSPTIGSVLSKMEAAARFINTQLNVAPCQAGMQVGRALANALTGSGDTDVPALSQRWRALQGVISDPVENLEQQATRTKADVAAELGGDPQWTIKGNLVWQSLREGYPAMSLDDARLIMSLVGTTVLDDSGTERHYPALLSVQDLLDAIPGQAYRVYQCPEPTECLAPQEVLETNVTGMVQRVRTVLYAILTNLQAGTPLPPGQADWLQQSSLPVYLLVKQYLHDPLAMQQFADASARLLAAEAIRHYVWNLTRLLTSGMAAYRDRHPNAKVDLTVVRAGLRAVEDAASEIARKEAEHLAARLTVVTRTQNQAEWARRMR